ncbi:MAG: tRNA lysidine(34) synthetase TilS [Erythrobacter sp.]|nr:tRNA lysidine(34) synthetase TilS [Erythrobacter sp.]
MLLAQAALPGRVEAATVDHGLREESAGEARFVQALCQDRGIPHTVLGCAVEPGNLQSQARTARYAVLETWAKQRGLAAIATAHHADDQAETLLMRLNRGSGLSGLAGIRAQASVPGGETVLLRPLLGWRRVELAEVVEAARVDPVRDPSNQDRRFDRVRVREGVRDSDWIDAAALARSAAHLAEAEAALDALIGREWSECVDRDKSTLRYRPMGSNLIRKSVVRRIIVEFGGQTDLSQTADLAARLEQGGAGTLAGVVARAKRGVWIFEAEPPRRSG